MTESHPSGIFLENVFLKSVRSISFIERKIVGYYYYKDGEKIGPVEFIKISDLLKSREITPETVVEQEDGNQPPP